MPNSVLTTAGLALFAGALHDEFTVPIDRIVFADIPGLDPTVTPAPGQGMPNPAHIVLNAEVEFSGKVDENTVVYSRILKATEGNYYINWIGLYSSEHNTLVAVCVVPRHQKFKTDGFQAGNTLYKNFALQFANASLLTGITIRPETWQYDFDTRYALKGHNHDERYEPLGSVNTHNSSGTAHQALFNAKAPLASPALTGTPTAPTAAAGDNSTKLATTAFAGAAANTAVDTHNSAANPHPGKFEAAGAVSTHNAAANPHPDKFDAAGTANTTVNNHNSAANPHPGKFEAAGAVNTHNSAANPHPDKFDAAGTANTAVNNHNAAANPHPGKFEAVGAVNTHNTVSDAHSALFAAKAPLASPALTGTPTAPTAAAGTSNTQLATTAFAGTAAANAVNTHNAASDAHSALFAAKAPLASPALTGTPTAPTAAAGDDSTKLATTAFVTTAIGNHKTDEFPVSLVGNGYAKLPNGLIIQWGISSYVNTEGGASTTFPLVFPTECLRVIAGTRAQQYLMSNNSWAQVTSFTTSGFSWCNQAAEYVGSIACSYIAIGY